MNLYVVDGSWDLVTRIIDKITICAINHMCNYITPIKVVMDLLSKSHDPLGRVSPKLSLKDLDR